MKPHTRALLLISLGDVEWRFGTWERAMNCFADAENLLPEIEKEESNDRDQQLVRVKKSIAFFLHDHGSDLEKIRAKRMLEEAFKLAELVSKDQQKAIVAELCKRGIGIIDM